LVYVPGKILIPVFTPLFETEEPPSHIGAELLFCTKPDNLLALAEKIIVGVAAVKATTAVEKADADDKLLTATVPLTGTGVALSCVSVKGPETGTAVARNCVSVSPPVATVPLIGTGVARSCASVSGCESPVLAVTVPLIGTGEALSCVSVKPVVVTVPDTGTGVARSCASVNGPLTGTAVARSCTSVKGPETGTALWLEAITTGELAAAVAWPNAGVLESIEFKAAISKT
jgi:hypothetical protein